MPINSCHVLLRSLVSGNQHFASIYSAYFTHRFSTFKTAISHCQPWIFSRMGALLQLKTDGSHVCHELHIFLPRLSSKLNSLCSRAVQNIIPQDPPQQRFLKFSKCNPFSLSFQLVQLVKTSRTIQSRIASEGKMLKCILVLTIKLYFNLQIRH